MPIRTITKKAALCERCLQEVLYGYLIYKGNIKITTYDKDSGHASKPYIQNDDNPTIYCATCITRAFN